MIRGGAVAFYTFNTIGTLPLTLFIIILVVIMATDILSEFVLGLVRNTLVEGLLNAG